MILAHLKERTQAHHDSLESNPHLIDLLNSNLSHESYQRILLKFLGFYEPVETLIEETLEKYPDFESLRARRKSVLLRQDVKALGLADDSIDTCTDLPDLGTLPRVLGCFYVFEGATLGGQLIARHLRRDLGLDVHNGAAFFNSYGEQVGPMWKAFGSLVAAYCEQQPADDEIIDAACETFIKFERWISKSIR